MQVILLEKIRNLGNLGDKVEVRAGYGRNFLIPQNKAVFATEKNIQQFETKRAELEKKAQASLKSAEERAEKLNEVVIKIEAQASEEGKLYGSIGPNEIKEALKNKKFEVSKREIAMPNGPLHSVGQYIVEIQLHSDVIANLQLEIVAAK